MQILECARAVTTSKVSRLHCNKMIAWNLAMREEKESVSANLRRPNAGFGYKGWLGFTGEYAKEVATVYEEKRESYKENVKEMNEEGHVGTVEGLKRAKTKGVKVLRETTSLLILKYEDIQYWPSRWHTSGTTAYIQSCLLYRPRFLQELWTVPAIEQPTISLSSTADKVLNSLKLFAMARIYAIKQANCSRYLRRLKEQQGEINSGC